MINENGNRSGRAKRPKKKTPLPHEWWEFGIHPITGWKSIKPSNMQYKMSKHK